MEKTNSLNSKIKRYAALATGVTAAAGATGQVVYTDVNPDEIISTSGTTSYLLDLDNNAVTDMAFVIRTATGLTGTMYGIPFTASYTGGMASFGSGAPATNGWLGISGAMSTNTSAGPYNLSPSSMIGSSAGNFAQSTGNLGAVVSAYVGFPYSQTIVTSAGNFMGNEGYVGIRFDISGATHYGWARVEVATDGKSMTIKDYAYESTAGTAIAAGDVGTGINETNIDHLISFVNIAPNKIIVKTNNLTNGVINVIGLDGKNVSNITINNNNELVNLSELASGIYVINITADEGVLSKKVYVR